MWHQPLYIRRKILTCLALKCFREEDAWHEEDGSGESHPCHMFMMKQTSSFWEDAESCGLD